MIQKITSTDFIKYLEYYPDEIRQGDFHIVGNLPAHTHFRVSGSVYVDGDIGEGCHLFAMKDFMARSVGRDCTVNGRNVTLKNVGQSTRITARNGDGVIKGNVADGVSIRFPGRGNLYIEGTVAANINVECHDINYAAEKIKDARQSHNVHWTDLVSSKKPAYFEGYSSHYTKGMPKEQKLAWGITYNPGTETYFIPLDVYNAPEHAKLRALVTKFHLHDAVIDFEHSVVTHEGELIKTIAIKGTQADPDERNARSFYATNAYLQTELERYITQYSQQHGH